MLILYSAIGNVIIIVRIIKFKARSIILLDNDINFPLILVSAFDELEI